MLKFKRVYILLKTARGKGCYLRKYKFLIGFTLIELLVVIAIIALLAAIILVSMIAVRARARDAARVATIHQFQTALELYYDDRGYYPRLTYITGVYLCDPIEPNCDLQDDLSPYLTSLPQVPLTLFIYDSNPQDNYQTYGLMVPLENSGNTKLIMDDGGAWNYAPSSGGCCYEVGPLVGYCMGKYGGNWFIPNDWTGFASTMCSGGN